MIDLSLGVAIVETWKVMAAHARECETCEDPVEVLRQVPGDPRVTDYETYEVLCPAGQATFTSWRDAKNAWLETTISHRTLIGVLGLSQEDADVRAEAIGQMPDPQYRRWLALPDEKRFAQLEALERPIRRQREDREAGRASAAEAAEAGEERRQCGWASCTTGPYGTHGSFVVNPQWPKQRYCCTACKDAAHREREEPDRPRRRLESTE